MGAVLTINQAARDLGTDARTVSGLVKALGITVKPVPSNGRGFGLDARDLRLLRQTLDYGRRRALSRSA